MSVQVINVLPIRNELSEIVGFKDLKISTLNKKSKSIFRKFYSFFQLNFFKKTKNNSLFIEDNFSINENILNKFHIENNEFRFANRLILNCESKIVILD